jgi:hypothetical protein
MAKYFSQFPKTYYELLNSNSLEFVTDITARVNFNLDLKNNTSAYYQYRIGEGDTPEIVAHKVYGSAHKHWVVLMFNQIIDPQFEWPMTYDVFNEFIKEKYKDNATDFLTGIEWAKREIHSYYKKITTTIDSDPEMVQYYRISEDVYNDLLEESYTTTLPDNKTLNVSVEKLVKTYYNFELEKNETRRNLYILKPEFVKYMDSELYRAINL